MYVVLQGLLKVRMLPYPEVWLSHRHDGTRFSYVLGLVALVTDLQIISRLT